MPKEYGMDFLFDVLDDHHIMYWTNEKNCVFIQVSTYLNQ